MRIYRLLFIASTVFTLSLLVNSCNKTDSLKDCEEHAISSCNDDPTKVNLRVKNVSEYDFCNVVVNPYNETTNCGILKAGESTCYRSYDVAFHYGYVSLKIGGKEFLLQPFDYVGETPLDPGYYTYSIDIEDVENGNISLEFN